MVNPIDVDSIANGMINLIVDKDLRKDLCNLGLKHVEQFSWESCAQQVLELLNSTNNAVERNISNKNN